MTVLLRIGGPAHEVRVLLFLGYWVGRIQAFLTAHVLMPKGA